MSYILDALKKAESERKLGMVPTVHAQPLPSAATGAPAPGWRIRLPWLFGLPIFVTLVVGIGWLQPWRPQPASGGDAPRSYTAPAANPLPLAPPMPSAPPFSSADTPSRVASRPKIAPVAPASIAANDGDSPGKSPNPADVLQPAAATPNVANVRAKATAAKVDPAEEKPVGTLQDLPENIQRELPTVAVSGYIYARNPADRTMLINKRLLHEGDQVGPDLMLEKMTPRGAVLNYKGYRYRVGY